jgi:hypothetical protein
MWTSDLEKLASEASTSSRTPRSRRCRRMDLPCGSRQRGRRPLALKSTSGLFFGGVATVVGKLFAQCRLDIAIFGEKDFQPLPVVTRMAVELDFGVKVIGSKTKRERDGLAVCSRNEIRRPNSGAWRLPLTARCRKVQRSLWPAKSFAPHSPPAPTSSRPAGFALADLAASRRRDP